MGSSNELIIHSSIYMGALIQVLLFIVLERSATMEDENTNTFKVEFSLENSLVADFSQNGKNKLVEETKTYATKLVEEAHLIAEAESISDMKIEVVGSHVAKAGRLKKKEYEKKNPTYKSICKIISPISFAISGYLFEFNGYQGQPGKQIAFIILFAIAAVSTVIANL